MSETLPFEIKTEELFDFSTFRIDRNPVCIFNWSLQPSYNGYPVDSIENIDIDLRNAFEHVKKTISEFIRNKRFNKWSDGYIEYILTSVKKQYQLIHNEFTDLPLRSSWLEFSKSYVPEGPNLYHVDQWESKCRDTFYAFFQIATLQLKYVENLIAFISNQLIHLQRDETKHTLVFILTEETSKKSTMILREIHERLKTSGYIDCSLIEFKKLFTHPSEPCPKISPTPVIWKTHYNHLTYFIKTLASREIIESKKSPSIYKIGLNLFYKGVKGRFFVPGKERYDNHLSINVQSKIQDIIEKSWLNSR